MQIVQTTLTAVRQSSVVFSRAVVRSGPTSAGPVPEPSLGASGKSQTLLYQAAAEGVSAATNSHVDLSSVMALTANRDGTVDVSPEATAGRIVAFSTGLFEKFKEQHPGEDLATVHQKFMETINKGITRGFAEARQILSGLGALQGDISANIDRTWDLVQQGLQRYETDFVKTQDAASASVVQG